MKSGTERIESLDISLFDSIPSQTNNPDKRSLLAVQRATARRFGRYFYLEIGSYLGGSLQPHLADDRCARIYSIDRRLSGVIDERTSGHIETYDENTTEEMLSRLRASDLGDISKIRCFDADASEIDVNQIDEAPEIAFIDGEHTAPAVLSDFRFCRGALHSDGTILFHDFDFTYPAIRAICEELDAGDREYEALKLDGGVFAIFFDPGLPADDAFLARFLKRQRLVWFRASLKRWLKQKLPRPLVALIRTARRPVVSRRLR